MNLKEVKRVLMTGKGRIVIDSHTRKRLHQRGYSKGDIVSAIFTGTLVEQQGANKILISGIDMDDNPIVFVIAKVASLSYKLVTVMPPIDHSRFKDCV